jgi:hypothetical protein
VILEKRKEMVDFLVAALPAVMKSGKLEEANAVDAAIEALKVEIAKLERSVAKEENDGEGPEVAAARVAEFQALKKRIGIFSQSRG